MGRFLCLFVVTFAVKKSLHLVTGAFFCLLEVFHLNSLSVLLSWFSWDWGGKIGIAAVAVKESLSFSF